jgi:hypothetical protein
MSNLPSMVKLITKQQLRWLGKVSQMDETRLPIKMLTCWNSNPCQSRRDQSNQHSGGPYFRQDQATDAATSSFIFSFNPKW